jgi:hypothetical protein
MSALISLQRWLTRIYGDDPHAPHLQTARRWCREGKIQPSPEKHGRSYFLDPDARYTDRPEPEPEPRAAESVEPEQRPRKPSLIERIRAEDAKAEQCRPAGEPV